MPTDTVYTARLLLRSLLQRPAETYDRLYLQLTDRWHIRSSAKRIPKYRTTEWDDVLLTMSTILGQDLGGFLEERERTEIFTQVVTATKEQLQDGPFRAAYNGDRRLADLCYAVCRAVKPQIVLETGVAYGVTSAYILQAMAVNQTGTLHSIDLPPVAALDLSKESFVGILIPQRLRDRWRLHRGTSARILPKLLPELGQVDMAVLDSRFTYEVKFEEMRMLEPVLARSSVLISDDVDRSPAFEDWISMSEPLFSAVVKESKDKADSMMGVSVHKSPFRKASGTMESARIAGTSA
jgi:predicted O-methyltransferase YrrM